MRRHDLHRPSHWVLALCLSSTIGLAGTSASANTISDPNAGPQQTTDNDATIIVQDQGVVTADCSVDDRAIDVLHDNYVIRIDNGGSVVLDDTNAACANLASAIVIGGNVGGTTTVNGLVNGAANLAFVIGTQNDVGDTEKTHTINIGETGEVQGSLQIFGKDNISITNDGLINGTIRLEHDSGTPSVTIVNNGTMLAQLGDPLISDTSTGAAGTTAISNVGSFDANGALDPNLGVMTGDLELNGEDRVYSFANSGTYTGTISFASPSFGGATISNSGVMQAEAGGTGAATLLDVINQGDTDIVLTFTNSFLGETSGRLSFGDGGDHILSNSGDMTGIIVMGDGNNRATLAAGFVQAPVGADLTVEPLLDLGAGEDTLTISGSRVQGQAGFITEIEDNGNVTGFEFDADANNIVAGTLINLGDDDDEATISGGALGGADTLLDMGDGNDTLSFTLNPLALIAIDNRSIITGGADTDTVAFNVAAHEDGFEFTDFAQVADFESLQVTAGTLILNPDANLFGVSGGTLTVNEGATLQVLNNANVASEFLTGTINGTLRVDGNLPLIAAGGAFTVNDGGILQFGIVDAGSPTPADPTLNGILQSGGAGTTVTLADGSAVELVLADQFTTGFTQIGQTSTVTIIEADTITIDDVDTALIDNDPFHEFTLIQSPGLLEVEIGRTPGFQQIALDSGRGRLIGTVGSALDAEYAACSDAERDGSDVASSFTPLCNAIATLGVTSNDPDDNLGIAGLLAVAAPDRTSGEHTMRVDTQKMLHSIVEKRADILRSRSRSLPAGVGTGQIDKPQQQSRLSGTDRQLAGLTDNLTDEIDGTGAGNLVDFGTGLGAGSVWSAHHLWMQVYTAFTERDDDRFISGYDGEQYGIAFGYDWRASRTWLFGLYGAYSTSEVDGNDLSNEQVDVDTISGGAYMSWFDRHTSWSSTLSFGLSDFEGERIGFGGTKLTRSHDGFEVGLSSSIDRNITVAKRLLLTPAFDMSFGLYDRDGYTEDGTFGLTVKGKTSYSLNTGISAKLAAPGQIGRTGVLPYIRTGAWHEFFDDNADTKASFTGSKAGSTFKVDGIQTASTQYLAGLGLDLVSARGRVNFSFGYNFIGGDDTQSHTLNSNLRFRF